MKIFYGLIVLIGLASPLLCFSQQSNQALFTLTGIVKDAKKGTPLISASVRVLGIQKSVITDRDGYIFRLPAGIYILEARYVGYEVKRDTIKVAALTIHDIQLTETSKQLEEVIITEQAQDRNISETRTGVTKLSIKTLKKISAIGGETDVLKSLLLLPGVTTVGEGATGFNVRGGNIDQNLILMDDAPIYNSSHLMGLLSVFNPDVVRDVTFFRGGIPAQYGGRVSSVAEVRIREPFADSLTVQGGVGLAASRLMLEGPLAGKKLSFLTAARGSFSDYLFKLTNNDVLKQTKANFYEFTAKLAFKPNEKNQFFLTGFLSQDAFKVAGDSLSGLEVNATSTLFRWKTANASLRWNHIINSQWVSNLVGVWSDYTSTMSNDEAEYAFDLKSKIRYQNVRYEVGYTSNHHKMDMGLNAVRYQITPGTLTPGTSSNVNARKLPIETSLELSSFFNDEWSLSNKLSLMYGLRFVYFGSMGPSTVLTYKPGLPREPENVASSTTYESGKIIQSYTSLEPRLTFRWTLDSSNSIKFSYHRLRQFVQLISNTTAALPTARWKTSDPFIRPQVVDQLSLGYYRNFADNAYELSTEVYYKDLTDVSDYRSGVNLLLLENPETAILQGKGLAYGLEMMLTKRTGKLTGWASYTYSQTKLLITSPYPEDVAFSGKWYPANFNKPHNLNVVALWQQNYRISYSINFTYSTGRPATFPQDKYYVDGIYIPNYTNRNGDKIPDYHRLDASMTINGKVYKTRRWQGSWVLSIYNLYGRKNAYSVFFRTKNDDLIQYYNKANSYKLAVFGSIIPSITYNFKF